MKNGNRQWLKEIWNAHFMFNSLYFMLFNCYIKRSTCRYFEEITILEFATIRKSIIFFYKFEEGFNEKTFEIFIRAHSISSLLKLSNSLCHEWHWKFFWNIEFTRNFRCTLARLSQPLNFTKCCYNKYDNFRKYHKSYLLTDFQGKRLWNFLQFFSIHIFVFMPHY